MSFVETMLLRYDLKSLCALGVIFFVSALAYKLMEANNNRIGKVIRTIYSGKSNFSEKTEPEHSFHKSRRYNSLRDLKEAAKIAVQNCLCSSKQRSSWFEQAGFKEMVL